MTQYQIPYVCPECDHDRWVTAAPEDGDSKAVKCPNCGFEDVVKLSSSATVVHGMDGMLDAVADELGLGDEG